MKHGKSILQTARECYICRKRIDTAVIYNLEKHHIFAGKNRTASEEHGFWVWLDPHFHTIGKEAVHGRDGSGLDLELKQDCQRKFEETHTRAEFLAIIGRNYL